MSTMSPSATTSKPLRILHLNSMLLGGGTDDQCVKLVQGLRQLGQEVFIAGPEGREISKVIHSLDLPLLNTGNGRGFKFTVAAAQLIRQHDIQVVHGHHGRDLWPTILAARLSGRDPKIVLTRHMAKSPSSWFSRRFLLGQCDVVIAVSQFVSKVLREGVYEPESAEAERRSRPPLLGDAGKIQVIYGGIDTTCFRPFNAQGLRAEWSLEPQDYAFGLVGGYNFPRGKGQREFLEAAARIHHLAPNARFLIIGRGNMDTLLKADIQRLGLAGKARLTPYCHDMATGMNALDFLVHSQIGTEAFGLVVCEAHACGKPVIASALDGIPEAFACGGVGQLVPPEDVVSLAKAMAIWSAKPRLNSREAASQHKHMEECVSLQKMASEVLGVYRGIVAR